MQFLFIFLFSFSVFAVKESQISVVYTLLNQEGQFYQIGRFKGEEDKVLTYAKFGHQTGSKGSLVFVNGFGENIFKYIELFYDLNLIGYSPIYTYDHRGQGFSESILPNAQVVHIESYKYYVKDLNTFIQNVVLEDKAVNQNQLFLIAHSMGATISLLYLQEIKTSIFKSVVLSAPLIRVHTRIPVFLENIALSFFRVLCIFQCENPTWNPKQKSLLNVSRDSLVRHQFLLSLYQRYPQLVMKEPTYQWVIEIFKATDHLMSKKQLQKIQTPILILQANNEDLVSNIHQNQFCTDLSHLCSLQVISGKHEIFMGRDINRDYAIKQSVQFFSK